MPAGTPRPMVAKLHADTVKLLADPEVKQKFAELGVVATSSSPEQFGAFIKSEQVKWGKVVREANITAE
jgi:tripartite-type tricarboxylate transporter receptor subunit TctC